MGEERESCLHHSGVCRDLKDQERRLSYVEGQVAKLWELIVGKRLYFFSIGMLALLLGFIAGLQWDIQKSIAQIQINLAGLTQRVDSHINQGGK